jgi:hypothetical protein
MVGEMSYKIQEQYQEGGRMQKCSVGSIVRKAHDFNHRQGSAIAT